MDVQGLVDAMVTKCQATGRFDAVNSHEPKAAPSGRLAAAVWAQRVRPAPALSGLAATSAVVEMNVRLYTSMLAEPQDNIDPAMVKAADVLLEDFTGDFTLGGLILKVDLLGAAGVPLEAQAGYLTIGQTMFRVITITVPLVVADAWTQTA